MRTRQLPVGVVLILLMFGLTACFRDAGTNSPGPTVVNVVDIIPTATRTNTPIPSFTPAREAQATKTMIVGGPPTGDEEADGEEGEATTVPTFTRVPDDEATLAPPGFADTGISPTPSLTPTLIPGTLLPTPTSIPEELDECIYYVQSGDTLFSIAANFDMFPDDFYAVNPELAINPNILDIGQALRIPGCVSDQDGIIETPDPNATPGSDTTQSSDDGDSTEGTSAPTGTQTYTVQAGDTLYSIAVRFGVTVDDIVAATDFLITENTIIREGDVLIIPAPSQ